MRFSYYELDGNGNVVPRGRLEGYDPFRFYYAPIPEKLARQVLSYKGIAGLEHNPLYIHTLWASINPSKTAEILAFVNLFGLPWINEPNIIESTSYEPIVGYYGSLFRPVPIQEIQAELRLFSWIATLAASVRGDLRQLREVLTEGFPNVREWPLAYDYVELELIYKGYAATIDTDSVEIALTAADVLETVFRIHQRHVVPRVIVGSLEEWGEWFDALEQSSNKKCSPQFSIYPSWEYDSLLSAMYLMLFLDFLQGRKIRKCGNSLCGRFFKANRDDQKYCSPECQNRAKVRRSKKKAKEQAGSSKKANRKEGENQKN